MVTVNYAEAFPLLTVITAESAETALISYKCLWGSLAFFKEALTTDGLEEATVGLLPLAIPSTKN